MSGSFTGFSEDDIRKLTNKNPQEVKSNALGNSKQGRPVLKPQKRRNNNPQTSDELRNKILNEKIQNSHMEPILETAKLSKPPELEPTLPANEKPTQNPQTTVLSSVENFHLDTIPKSGKFSKTPEGEASTESSENVTQKEVPLLERKRDLEEFEAKQKLIEEQNRKRKELLIKALAAKTKQTQEETQRLNEIREEFKKLDALLSNDVKFLRKQIEVASLDYMEAQKKYFRIEKEFLEAKLFLHQKLERKEMLTEHLCTIIEKNEERKAEKLNELLSKLNLKADLQNDDNSNKEKSSDNVNDNVVVIEQTDNNLKETNDNSKSDNSEKKKEEI